MKRNYYNPILVVIFVLSIATSCKKENDASNLNQNYTTEQVEKIQSNYQYLSALNNTSGEKIETSATDDYILKIQSRISESSPIKVSNLKSFSGNGYAYVGVLKSGSCGQFPEFGLYMDCEDNRPASRKIGSWTGDSYVDGNGNINLKFCVVPQSYMTNQGTDYAVLRLGAMPSATIGHDYYYELVVYLDNEDGKHGFSYYVPGAAGSATPDNLGAAWPNVIGDNTTLCLLYYPGNSSTYFYNFGISYGVFGNITSYPDANRGQIYSDDEDGSNANWMQLNYVSTQAYDRSAHFTKTSESNTNFHNIVSQNSNTLFYMTKVQ